MKKVVFLFALFTLAANSNAQKSTIEEFEEVDVNWQSKDFEKDNILGISTELAYETLLKNKEAKKTVIVAVIDGGVDVTHDDLDDKIWINEDEIPNNNIDDDNNGYIDDINGWSFLGNSKGENIKFEQLEITRIYAAGDTDDPLYDEAKKLYEEETAKHVNRVARLEGLKQSISDSKALIKDQTGIDVEELEDLDLVPRVNREVRKAKKYLKRIMISEITDELIDKYIGYSDVYFDYHLNKEFTPRTIIGDNVTDINDNDYGNNDVKGPRSEHGTGVAGIIGAERNNGIGIDGIAENIKIMVLRAVPMGDERDKDIALAIRYAVDNGAEIINMSFGKDLSPHKEFVDEAVKYAEENDVLLVHAAGNDGENIDFTGNFPSDVFINKNVATNYITIGASSKNRDKELPASFSNYGATNVDIFAPGVDIVTTDSNNIYQQNSGTSFAAPVVTGVAALVLSYYPDLTSKELIEILLNSSVKPNKPRKVIQPGTSGKKSKKVKFETLSKTGGLVNAYSALELAQQVSANK